jgi:hypothetical protein
MTTTIIDGPGGHSRAFSCGALKHADWVARVKFSSSRAARERKIEDRVARRVVKNMSIGGQNYERSIISPTQTFRDLREAQLLRSQILRTNDGNQRLRFLFHQLGSLRLPVHNLCNRHGRTIAC